MPPADLVRYLVLEALSGRSFVLLALYRVLVLEEDPRRVSRDLGISLGSVREYVSRSVARCGSRDEAKRVLGMLYARILSISPVFADRGDAVKCLLCSAIVKRGGAQRHLNAKHRDLLDGLTEELVKEVVSGGGGAR